MTILSNNSSNDLFSFSPPKTKDDGLNTSVGNVSFLTCNASAGDIPVVSFTAVRYAYKINGICLDQSS